MCWMKFKMGQHPRVGEIIAVKGCAGIYPHLLKVFYDENGIVRYCRLGDEGTQVVIDYGITHWKLVDALSDVEGTASDRK